MIKAIFLCDSPENIDRVYSPGERELIRGYADLSDSVYRYADIKKHTQDCEAVFSTWGMPALTGDQIDDAFPRLKAVFYAAGSVRHFASPFLERGIKVFSAWQANAVPVAEYTFAQISLAAKGAFALTRLMRSDPAAARELAPRYPGLYGIKVGVLGLGAIGFALANMLKNVNCDVYAYDPFTDENRFSACGARRADMEWIFANCDVVTNHIANLPATVGIIKREYLFSMKEYATFINTGRGPQLDENDLYELLGQRSDLTALLDVLTDEKNAAGSPLMTRGNCFITPHIAGSSGNEVRRMALYMAEELQRYAKGQPLKYEVTMDMLRTMA